MFAGTASSMAAIRGKDDYKNWAAGGAASGALFGLNSKSDPYFKKGFLKVLLIRGHSAFKQPPGHVYRAP